MNKTGLITRVGIAAIFALAFSTLAWAEGDTVISPVKRQQGLDRAKKLLAAREIPTGAADPFHPEAFTELVSGSSTKPTAAAPVNVVVAGPRTDRDILQAIATSLKPSGNFVLSGQPTLVFGQKRVKAGGILTITFEGTEYTLEVTSIERTNFTLRLNREEFTRPIK